MCVCRGEGRGGGHGGEGVQRGGGCRGERGAEGRGHGGKWGVLESINGEIWREALKKRQNI